MMVLRAAPCENLPMRRLYWLAVLGACGDPSSSKPDASAGDAALDAPACARTAKPANRTRHVVVSHPYDANGAKTNTWEVLDLSATGELTRPGRTFVMGVALEGEVAFTADGEIGIAVQDDGSLGVFRIDDAGVPTVITNKLTGSFYAHRVVIAGDHAYVLDNQWRDNGGGIYRIDIACDGTVTERGKVVEAKLPSALAFIPGTTKAILAAADIGASDVGADAHLLSWSGSPSVLASTDAFGDDQAIVGGATLTSDGAFFLIGDHSGFSNVPNRVSVVTVSGDQLGTPTVIPNINDPVALISSPFGPTILVVSGFDDAFYVIRRGSDGVFRADGEVTYQGPKPELPFGAVMIEVGALRGLVLVAENAGVRRVEHRSDGSIVDRGKFPMGSGLVNVVGAIGVQP